jgi:FlgD Ig-like domain
VTRAVRAVFAVLVLATLGAFVVTQKLKSAPPLVVRPHISSVFSPAPGARVREARVSFWIVHADDVTISIVDSGGRIVRTLLDGGHVPARVRIARFWNGRTSSGARAPDGRYRVRVALIHQGRTIDLPQRIALDTRPPRPRVTGVTPQRASGPAFWPQHGVHALTVHVRGTEGRRARLLIYRTDVTPPRRVGTLTIPPRQASVVWDGTLGGRPAPAGTYLMGLLVADRAGNVGSFPAPLPGAAGNAGAARGAGAGAGARAGAGLVPAGAAGASTAGSAAGGRAGVTVRRLAAAPPLVPVTAGAHATVLVDARDRPYAWALRRDGDAKPLAHGRGRGARLRVRIPRQQSGIDVLTLVAGGARTAVPVAVRGTRPHSLLVVLPALTWQGRNPVDDDGDGLPNTLDTAGSIALARPFANGLPASVRAQEGALLRFLDAQLLRFDLTTDAALATGAGPALKRFRGVVLAGDERWITPQLAARLRAYVRGGGRVWSLGVDSLRRTVSLRGGVLVDPSDPRPADALGARPRQPLVRAAAAQPATMTLYVDDPSLGLFSQTGGAFPGYTVYEALAPFGPGAKLLSAAGPVAGTPVIAAWRLGSGVAIHTGLPQLAARALAGDPNAAALVQRIWAILRE